MSEKKCWCGRDAEIKDQYCIFHAPNAEKDPNKFWRRFSQLFQETLEEFEKAGNKKRNDTRLDCKRFVFPKFGMVDFPEEVPFEVSFLGAVFEFGADFSLTTFGDDVWFSRALFGAEIIGTERIEEQVNKNRVLEIETRFLGTKFGEGAWFNETRFYCPAVFYNAKHIGNKPKGLLFGGTRFYDDFILSDCEMDGEVSFYDAVFTGDLNASEASFHSNAVFYGVVFKGDARFDRAEFNEKAIFSNITVEKKLSLSNIATSFRKDTNGRRISDKNGHGIIQNPDVELHISDSDLNPSAKLLLDGTSLKKVSFANTRGVEDFKIVDFKGAIWKKPKETRKVIYDEVLARRQEEGDPTYEDAADVYRRLRLNYEGRLAYEAASDFHIGQMEMLLLSVDVKKSKKIFLSLYKAVSNFGESVKRPIFWFLGVWGFFTLVWLSQPAIPSFEQILRREFVFPWNWVRFELSYSWFKKSLNIDWVGAPIYIWNSIWRTFVTFITGSTPMGGAFFKVVAAFQRVVGASVITLFILALRRAFRR